MNRSARACEWEEKAETEAPFACPDPECSITFNGIVSLRKHMKREHLNKWSPRHKYIRANNTNIKIPEEMSQSAELKTLTENDDHQRESCGLRRAAKWRRNRTTEGGRS